MALLIMKKKKYKFQVDVCLEELLEVPFVSAVLFAKLRLLDGGSFQDHSSREEVTDHKVKWETHFRFRCKMLANATTGVLERCILRISVRKECKGGRSFTKLGFVDLNLAEFAGAGVTYKRALLEGYDSRRRQDNSMLKYSITMSMLSGDILFKVPSTTTSEDPATEVRSDDFSSGSHAGSIASGSSGFGSLPKKRPALLSSELVADQPSADSSCSGATFAPPTTSTATTTTNIQEVAIVTLSDHEAGGCDTGHSRNSSNTSQLSKASGYSSVNSHTHSRQSSSGESAHTRNPSAGSLVLSETGSLDRAKAAYDRRKKPLSSADVESGGPVAGRVEITRVNPDHLIAELLKSTNLEQADESAESSGLQLFIAEDGTAAVGNHEVKSQMSTGLQMFKQVVMDDNDR